MSKITLSNEAADPTTPSAGNWIIYPKSGGWYARDSAGNVYFLAPLSDGDKGDIVVSSSGTVWTIDTKAVTLAKMNDMATASLLGRNTAGTGTPEVLSAATVRTLLGLVIGTNVQAWDTDLDTWAGKTPPSGTVLGTTDAQTVTGKRNKPRIYATTSIAGTPGTLTPEIDTYDYYELTAQAAALNIANMSTSTPTGGESIVIAITPDATPRALTYGTNYVAKGGVALPSITVASKTLTLGFKYNAGLNKWNLLAVAQEA